MALLMAAPATAQAPATAEADRPSIALLDIAVQNDDDKELAGSIGALLAERVGRLGAFDVITQDDVRRMISFDRMKVALSCEDEASCLSEIGGAVGARYLISGALSRLDEQLFLAVSLIDIELVKTISRETLSASNAVDLSGQLDGMLTGLLGSILLEWRGSLLIESDNAGASIFIDDRAVGVVPLGPYRTSRRSAPRFGHARRLCLLSGRRRRATQRSGRAWGDAAAPARNL